MPPPPVSRSAGRGSACLPNILKNAGIPRNRAYYWVGCDGQTDFDSRDIDGAALCDHYISITPIKCDTTDYHLLEELKTWEWGKD